MVPFCQPVELVELADELRKMQEWHIWPNSALVIQLAVVLASQGV